MKKQTHTPLSDEEIHDLVEVSLHSGTAIGVLLDRALFPEGVPRMWGHWPQEAREQWDQGVRVYEDRRREVYGEPEGPHRIRHDNGPEPTVAEVWAALSITQEEPNPKMRMTWKHLGILLQMRNRRRTQYVLSDKMGFVIGGPRGEKELQRAPCVECEEVCEAEEIEEWRCPSCQAGQMQMAS